MSEDDSDSVVDEIDIDKTGDVVLPDAPERPELDSDDRLTKLRSGVINALGALPGYFAFDNPISGVNATDLFNLNTLLGAGIEVEVVKTLNRLRELWDPDSEWTGYRFERSSQAFPDVRLAKRDLGGDDIALGIELKGWFLFAKEGVPSLRFQVAPAACTPHDLVCVVPWYLSNAVSGTPQVTEPWIESARYAAEYRDYWWEHIRISASDRSVSYPPHAAPYPQKADLVSAVPAYDGGGNFGRLPRARPLMDDFVASAIEHEVLGIAAEDWLGFLKLHTDTASAEAVRGVLQTQLATRDANLSPDSAAALLAHLDAISQLLSKPGASSAATITSTTMDSA